MVHEPPTHIHVKTACVVRAPADGRLHLRLDQGSDTPGELAAWALETSHRLRAEFAVGSTLVVSFDHYDLSDHRAVAGSPRPQDP
ncbi:hypothetical protein EV191_108200 [Tamaricihabitans halophyticus]|uniref:Uncharacterized protein n=1 Tax=Tamaricihabitans halophyticus TaxID=1262583 RepID=A0A4R2QSS2_9PSEU|nr:hypothetical protein [Tamaricihabitans halophyticus]TCP50111.1 hypothetical protein EV191_108200 [Tamaricihabitans halophyticus]